MTGANAQPLADVIRELLNRHAFLHEKRIQKLVFLADLHSIQTRGKRLVEVDFKKYYHGVYSEGIHLALQNLPDVRAAPETTIDGSETLVFLRPERPFPTQLSNEQLEVLTEATDAYRGFSTDQLAQIGKHTLFWENAEHGEEFDYAAYVADPSVRLSPAMGRAYDVAVEKQRKGELPAFSSAEALLDSIPC